MGCRVARDITGLQPAAGLLGNDVVDLRDPETKEAALHPRFDGRVFRPAERERLEHSPERHQLRWILWAAKEAAYKALCQIDADLSFSPARFEVDPDRGTVRWNALHLALLVDVDDDRVHVVASGSGDLSRIVHASALADDPDRGLSVRQLARRLLRGQELPPPPIGFGRERRIPFAISQGRRLPVNLSFSHHGRFVAVAARPREVSG